MTMATSVELRVPLLDHKILEFAAALPPSFKVRGWTTKRILKLALKGSVPDTILKRKKAGFPLPYDQWLKNELRDFVNDTILSQNTALDSYFNRTTVREMLERQQRNGSENRNGGMAQNALDYSREIYGLLILELWHKQFHL